MEFFETDQIKNFINSEISENILFYAIVFSSIIGIYKEKVKSNIFTVWVFSFIGTFFHELAHFVVSLCTFGKPVSFNIFPSKKLDPSTGTVSYVLGSVSSANMKWYNSFFISMAPLLLLPFSYYVYLYFFNFFEVNTGNILLYIYIIVTLVFSAIPSSQDFSNFANNNFLKNLVIPIVFFISLIFILVIRKSFWPL